VNKGPDMKNILTTATALLTIGALSLCITGCAPDKMIHVNYETVYEGLDQAGVIKRMGEPTEKTDDEWTYTREHGGRRNAIIRFKDGLVISKSWKFE